ncbi:MAG: hypothetical protein IBX72_09170 [Nitrospirae bacterium]|nr:hypothetical protein [Nitrospirota bacterium]
MSKEKGVSILYLKILFIILIVLSLFAGSSLAVAEEDPCREEGIVVKNLTLTSLWFKRDGGDCYIWQRNKIFVIRPQDNIEIFSDLTCETKYCNDLTYKDYKSFDEDGNCRVRILTGCTLSDM